MAAMVQTYPQQTGTVTMLQPRPSSSSAIMPGHSHQQSHPHSQASQQQFMANTRSHRNSFHGMPGVMGGQQEYRGSSTGPVQPYAFTATPNLTNNGQWQTYAAYRTASTPGAPTLQTMELNAAARPRYHTSASTPAVPSVAGVTVAQGMSRDDMSLPTTGRPSGPGTGAPRPQSTFFAGSAGQPTFAQVVAAKASPERYRRPIVRQADSSLSQQSNTQQSGSAMPSGSGMATVVHLYNPRATAERKVSLPRNPANVTSRPQSAYASADDMQVRRQPTEEELKRFRRRSIHSFDANDYPTPMTPQELKQQHLLSEEQRRLSNMAVAKKADTPDKEQKSVAARIVSSLTSTSVAEKSKATHARSGSAESLASSKSSNSRPSSATNRNSNATPPTASPASTTSSSDEKSSANNPDSARLVAIPPRSSSSDVGKRVLNPSPLSKPVTMAPGSSSGDSSAPAPADAKSIPAAAPSPTKPPGSSHGSIADSPAAKHLAAINEKGGRPKSKTSRLRRAFSFSSAAELRKAQSEEKPSPQTPAQNEASKLHKDPRPEEMYEEEQARIAQKQEASGLGNSIYSGTKIFSGSADNLSISSTASSASIMLRKMGRGVKKGGRSLVGLFRPKSMIGAPIGDSSGPEASQAEVSMITVEAERERVNVSTNADLDQPSGPTGFPHLERNSIDAMDSAHLDSLHSDRLGSSGTDNSGARKSIVGGEAERAEVLATIRKGILKTRSNSPSPTPRDTKAPAFELPMIPTMSDSPMSSAPSTPTEDAPGHKRTGSVAIGSEDYFMSALRLRQDTKSAPGTPQGGISKRNATFSPRIVFHDTWPSGEYDRRGEISTCNRLTPMLAQQIKEELNSFKMEMEVHETSKIYTHFF